MVTLSDEELVRWCQRTLPNDTRAFEALVARYKQRVFATTLRMMGNAHDAEDIAQEVFIKVYRGVRDLAEPATLASWIYRTTTRACLDALDKRRVRPAAPLDDDQGDKSSHADPRVASPEESALREELRTCLESTLRRLDPPTRAVLVLRDIEGRSYQEIAESVVSGLSAVKMRIHRARLAFQRLFATICPELHQSGADSGVC